MPYLVDTDLVIDHLADIPEAQQLLDKLAPEGIAISIITYMEAYQGVIRSVNAKEAHAKFQIFRRSIPVLPFSLTVAKRCAALREQLKNSRLTALQINRIITLELASHLASASDTCDCANRATQKFDRKQTNSFKTLLQVVLTSSSP